MRAILDTNVLIDGALDLPGYDVAVTSLSYAELRFGLSTADPATRVLRAARLERLERILGPGTPSTMPQRRASGT